jgi:hypothetical protein
MKIKCTKCETVKETGNVEYEAIDMGLAIHCTVCGCAQPHERATEVDNQVLKNLNDHVELHHDDATVIYPTGCEECVIGTFFDEELEVARAIISMERLQAHFEEEFKEDETPEVAAIEWISFNVLRGADYQGPGKPIFVQEVTGE